MKNLIEAVKRVVEVTHNDRPWAQILGSLKKNGFEIYAGHREATKEYKSLESGLGIELTQGRRDRIIDQLAVYKGVGADRGFIVTEVDGNVIIEHWGDHVTIQRIHFREYKKALSMFIKEFRKWFKS